jgi:[ribosomal protein S5]-alanine N-acetyltransferase
VFPSEFPLLETDRLVLRRLSIGDAGAIFGIMSDAETMKHMDFPPMAEIGEAEASLAREQEGFAAGGSLRWGLTLRGEDDVIGSCTLFQISLESRRAELGYFLGRPYWGQGYNHEALTRVVEYAFAELGLNRIEAELDPQNAASARAVHRLGFVDEGLLRERWIVSGVVSDSLMVGLLRSDWEVASRRQTLV